MHPLTLIWFYSVKDLASTLHLLVVTAYNLKECSCCDWILKATTRALVFVHCLFKKKGIELFCWLEN